jgi:hypothetical protein
VAAFKPHCFRGWRGRTQQLAETAMGGIASVLFPKWYTDGTFGMERNRFALMLGWRWVKLLAVG